VILWAEILCWLTGKWQWDYSGFFKGGTEFTAIAVDVGTANNSEPVLLLAEVWYIYSFSHIMIICLPGKSMEVSKSIGQMPVISFSV